MENGGKEWKKNPWAREYYEIMQAFFQEFDSAEGLV